MDAKPINLVANEPFAFFLEFLKHPLQLGSVIPSSRFLEKRVLESAEISTAKMIVELGPGTGGTTRSILNAMGSDARLLSIEINPQFLPFLARIEDERLIAHLGSAANLRHILALYNLPAPDVIVSGIPFSTMSESIGTQVIKEIAEALAPDGCFVAYQARSKVATLCRPVLGEEKSAVELLNIPPMRVYKWERNGGRPKVLQNQ